MKRKLISIVTPVFNEEGGLQLYKDRIVSDLLNAAPYDFEVIFVDDGSTDLSWDIIQKIAREDNRFRGCRLSRNYGSHIAISAGIDEATGDAVSTLDCDLQNPPKVVLDFIREWEIGAEIVWGQRQNRDDESWKIWTSKMFNWILKRFVFPKRSQFTTGSFLLMDKKVADCFKRFKEANRVTFALVAWSGFRQSVVGYRREARAVGNSGWSFSRMLKTVYDTIIGFSSLPIRIITWIGVLWFAMSTVLTFYLIYEKLRSNPQPGWTGIMVLMSLFFAIQSLSTAVLGEYLSRIYSEVVMRPIYFISQQTDQNK